MSIACVALFAAFANGESLIPQGANVAPPTGPSGKTLLSAFFNYLKSALRTPDGKAKAAIAPDGASASFFLRVRVKQRIGMCTLISTRLGMFTHGGI